MSRSSAQLEREAEQIRAELAATLDELRGRLTPGRLVDETLDYVGHAQAGEFVRNLGRDVRANPLPVAMVGAGVAWLMVANGRSRRGEAARVSVGTAANLVTSLGQGGAADDARRGLLGFCKEQPWLLAGLGLAVGAVLAGVLPRTGAQDQLSGASEEVKANLQRGPAPAANDVHGAGRRRSEPGIIAGDHAVAGGSRPHEPRSVEELEHHP